MWMRTFKLTSLVDHYGNNSPLLARIEENIAKKHTSVYYLMPILKLQKSVSWVTIGGYVEKAMIKRGYVGQKVAWCPCVIVLKSLTPPLRTLQVHCVHFPVDENFLVYCHISKDSFRILHV